jgi:hypothetical protein
VLVAADAGDEAAEAQLLERYRSDERLHPGETVVTIWPNNGEFVEVSLAR